MSVNRLITAVGLQTLLGIALVWPFTVCAQSTPTFEKTTNTTYGTSGQPAGFPNNSDSFPAIAYRDSATGNLFYGPTYDGASYQSVNTGFAMNYPSAAITYFNGLTYILFSTNSGFEITTTPDGYSFTTPQLVYIDSPTGYLSDQRPGLTVFNNTLYLSTTVAYGQGYAIALFTSTDGINYLNENIITGGYTTGGSSMYPTSATSNFPAQLAITWTESPNNVPILAVSSNGSIFTTTAVNNFPISGDPTVVQWTSPVTGEPAIYICGRSSNSGGHLLIAGTYDEITFPAPTQYSAALTSAPSALISGYTQNPSFIVAYQGSGQKLYLLTTVTE